MRYLLSFCQYGRSEFRHSGVWNLNEDHNNAMWRNLSLMTDRELQDIRRDVAQLADAITETLAERNIDR